jgi:hypothetical protein
MSPAVPVTYEGTPDIPVDMTCREWARQQALAARKVRRQPFWRLDRRRLV